MARLLGYWHSAEEPYWPDPGHFVDERWDERERAQVAHYLRGYSTAACAGLAFCRFRCSTPHRASAEHFDGDYIWPEALAHYVADHRVRLPDEFVAHALRGEGREQHDFPDSVDRSWWLGQRRSLPRLTFLTRGDVGHVWLRGFEGDDLKGAALWLRRFETGSTWSTAELLGMLRMRDLTELSRERWAQISYREWTAIALEASALGFLFEYVDQDAYSSSYAAALDALGLYALDMNANLAMRVALMPAFEPPIVVDVHVRADAATVVSWTLREACNLVQTEHPPAFDRGSILSRTMTVTRVDLDALSKWSPPATRSISAAVADGTQSYVERFERGVQPLCWKSDVHVESQDAADELLDLVRRWLPRAP